MKIKFDAKTIEISKTFADRASHFGSMEYAELRSATNDLPDFKVVVKSAPKRRRTYAKGLTYDFMAKPITAKRLYARTVGQSTVVGRYRFVTLKPKLATILKSE